DQLGLHRSPRNAFSLVSRLRLSQLSSSKFRIIAARCRLSAGHPLNKDPVGGRTSATARFGHRLITPNVTRAPEFPAGSIFSRSGSAWTSESIVSRELVPSALTSGFGKSPAWG